MMMASCCSWGLLLFLIAGIPRAVHEIIYHCINGARCESHQMFLLEKKSGNNYIFKKV